MHKPSGIHGRRRRLAVRRLTRTLGAGLGLGCSLCAPFSAAEPAGGVVVGGSGTIAGGNGQQVITQTSDRLAIDWQQFSLAPGERTEFRQPSASSVALNRVVGGARSDIHGEIRANGQVFLVNPSGVLFGPSAQVDVGGLVASTLDLSVADFMAGKSTFTDRGQHAGVTARIENQGRLQAAEGGYVALIAAEVVNSGSVRADRGTVALAAGEQVSLKFDDRSLVAVTVERAALDALVDNRDLIRADGGTVLMTARARDALLDTVVNNDGIIEANTVGEHAGVIRLGGGETGVVESRGVLRAQGDAGDERGGRIELTGQRIALTHDAQVDASGQRGGGTINLGGNREGQGPLPASQDIFVGAATRVTANAGAHGDGGSIVLFAADTAQIHGQIEARGGTQGGRGGFVETSGKQSLYLTTTPLVTATAGDAGLWLIDPINIILSATSNACVGLSGCLAGPDWSATATGATLGVNLINAALNAGQNVTLTTGAGGAQAGDITFSGNPTILKSAGATDVTLTLRAHNDVALTRPISHSGAATGRLNVVLTGDSDNSGAGSVSLRNTITTGGGTVNISGTTVGIFNNITSAGTAGRNGGDVQITARPTGFVNMAGGALVTSGGTATGAGTDAGDVNISGGTVTMRAITASGGNAVGANLAGGAAGTITLDATGATPTVTLGGNVTARGGNGNGTGAGGAGGAVTITDPAILSADVAVTTTQGTGTPGATGGSVAFGNVDSNPNARRRFTIAAGSGSVVTGDLGNAVPLGTVSLAGTGGVATGNLTTSGLANANGSAVTVNAGNVGVVTLGRVTTRGGAATGVGRAGGALALTGRRVSTGDIDTSGTNAVAGAGGAAGAVAMTVSGTAADLSLPGTVTANGGNGAGGAGGASGAITLTGPVTLRQDVSLTSLRGTGTSNGTAGTIAFNSAATTINADATPRSLTLSGNGTVRLLGAIGQNQALDTLSLAGGGGVALPTTRLLGDLDIDAAGPVTDTGTLRVDGNTTVRAGTSAITLDNPANDFVGAVSAQTSAGAVTVTDANSLVLGASTSGATFTATANGDIRIAPGASVASSAGNVVLAARGGDFINDSGANALSAPAGRWLVYATSPADNVPNGLAPGNPQPNLYDRTFAANPPASIAPGNHFVFSLRPALTVTADAIARVFGDPDPGLSVTTSGLLAGDVLADAFAGTLARLPGEAPGDYAITASGVGSPIGYAVNVVPGTFTIARRPITIAADPLSKIFGNADPVLGFSVTSGSLATIAGSALNGSLARASGEAVGSYAIGQGTLGNPNYAISFVANDFSIVPRPITLAATAQSRVFGEIDPTLGFSVSSGTLVATAEGALNGALARAPGENVGRYEINQGTLGNPNYAISFVPGQFDITPRPLALTAANVARVFGDPDPAFAFTVTGGSLAAIPGGELGGALARAPGENVGAYAIGQGALDNPNYQITFVPGRLDITPRAVTLAATTVGKAYGDADPALAFTVTAGALVNLPEGALAGALTRAPGENVGRYAIGRGTLDNPNYALSFVPGSFDIVPRPLAIRANDAVRAVGAPNPPFSASFSGFAFGEGPGVLGGALGFLTPADQASTPGAYRLTPTGLTALNYALTFVDGTLTVSARADPLLPPISPPAPATVTATPAPGANGAGGEDAIVSARQPEPPGAPGIAGLARLEVIDGGIRLPADLR